MCTLYQLTVTVTGTDIHIHFQSNVLRYIKYIYIIIDIPSINIRIPRQLAFHNDI